MTDKHIKIYFSNFDNFTELVKQTPLGQKIMSEIEPMEMWVDDISPDGKIIGRLEMVSGIYESSV